MLDINLTPLREGFARFLPAGVAVALLMAVSMGLVVGSDLFHRTAPEDASGASAAYSNTEQLGRALYSQYLYPFEIAGAILLVAIIAAISLTMRKPRTLKTPRPEQQVTARREERVRLVKMEAEK